MKQSVRRLSLDREPWREELVRALLAGAAEGVGAACLVVVFVILFGGWK